MARFHQPQTGPVLYFPSAGNKMAQAQDADFGGIGIADVMRCQSV